MAWIDLTQNRGKWRVHVDVYNAKNFLASRGTNGHYALISQIEHFSTLGEKSS